LRPANENDEIDRRQEGLAVGRRVHQVLAEDARDGEFGRGEAGRQRGGTEAKRQDGEVKPGAIEENRVGPAKVACALPAYIRVKCEMAIVFPDRCVKKYSEPMGPDRGVFDQRHAVRYGPNEAICHGNGKESHRSGRNRDDVSYTRLKYGPAACGSDGNEPDANYQPSGEIFRAIHIAREQGKYDDHGQGAEEQRGGCA